MVAHVHTITFDSADPEKLGRFWAQATGYGDDPAYPNSPGDPEWLIAGPGGVPRLLFVRVPEGKAGKNRLHLDLRPQDRDRDAETERLTGLGARLLHDRRQADGTGWVVLADPEGNEFCVERSDAERS